MVLVRGRRVEEAGQRANGFGIPIRRVECQVGFDVAPGRSRPVERQRHVDGVDVRWGERRVERDRPVERGERRPQAHADSRGIPKVVACLPKRIPRRRILRIALRGKLGRREETTRVMIPERVLGFREECGRERIRHEEEAVAR